MMYFKIFNQIKIKNNLTESNNIYKHNFLQHMLNNLVIDSLKKDNK